MAYAAITKSLIEEVKGKLNIMEEAELNGMPNPDNIIGELTKDEAFRTDIINKLWEPVQDIRGRLEQYNVNHVQVSVISKRTDEAGNEHKLTVNVKDMTVPLTAKVSKEYYGPLIVELVVDNSFNSKFSDYFAAKEMRKEAQVRWKAVRTQVTNFLNSCKSANEALKLWPDVARYLPKDTIAKVNQKSEKAKKEESNALEALKAINIDAVNTSTVLARMAGAQV